ncbi:MAG: bifunctional riboflavin kinase/FAD synthetase [Nitrospirae bacterium]|nr:bifunctional riboflavin kinase/FAD synthetase [Nitrospirota bacterium]
MQLITDLNDISGKCKDSVVTLGNFDGLHLGHQALVKMVIDRAKEINGTSVVVTFHPHPLKILAPDKCPPLISIYEEKITLFTNMGVDVLVKIPFTLEFASKSPGEFVKDILYDSLNVKEIFVGHNYRFGRGRKGNIERLKDLGVELGFRVNEIDYIAVNGEVVSSTKIRNLLKDGEIEHAAKLLGRPYAITGIVVQGDGRGKALGFPTANIVPEHEIIPAKGVYAVKVFLRGQHYNGIANIGYRPTFGKDILTTEANIFDLNEDIYGEKITLYFIHRIRDEKKFPSVDALVQQIKLDVEAAKNHL